MQNIDKVRVNGTEYEITMGGNMPVRGYEGTENSGIAEFFDSYDYVPDEDVEFAYLEEHSYYIHRTGSSGNERYDLVLAYIAPSWGDYHPAYVYHGRGA
jgi:hypothetical protein